MKSVLVNIKFLNCGHLTETEVIILKIKNQFYQTILTIAVNTLKFNDQSFVKFGMLVIKFC